jgi:hypothetical protein
VYSILDRKRANRINGLRFTMLDKFNWDSGQAGGVRGLFRLA